MSRILSSHLLVGAILASTGIATAQGTNQFVPSLSEYVMGQGSNNPQRTWGSDTFRSQQVIPASEVSMFPSVINSIAYRMRNAPLGGTFSDVVIKISYTNATPLTMDTTFANNIVGAQTTVWDTGTTNPAIVFPPFDSSTVIGDVMAPWVEIQFRDAANQPAPFVFDPALGNLLIDITVATAHPLRGAADPSCPACTYTLNVDGNMPGGADYRWGEPSAPGTCGDGPFPGEQYRMTVAGNRIAGGSGGFQAGLAESEGFTAVVEGRPCFVNQMPPFVNSPVAIFFSVDQPVGGAYPALPTPVELTSVGAPGNFDYIGLVANPGLPIANLTMVPPMFFGGPKADIPLPLPSPTWLHKRILMQAVTVDIGANALNVVFSNACAACIGIGGGDANQPTNQVTATDPTSATGSDQGAFGAPFAPSVKININ